jgi:DNA-binding Lrp family transcriptional regulator
VLGAVDRRILAELQRDGRLSNAELADRIGLSPSPCLRRVKRLEERGVIARYAALLDAGAVDRSLVVFVRVRLERDTRPSIEAFERQVRTLPEVLECYCLLGTTDYLLPVAARDLDGYRRWYMSSLASLEGIATLESEVSMYVVKHSTELPL